MVVTLKKQQKNTQTKGRENGNGRQKGNSQKKWLTPTCWCLKKLHLQPQSIRLTVNSVAQAGSPLEGQGQQGSDID